MKLILDRVDEVFNRVWFVKDFHLFNILLNREDLIRARNDLRGALVLKIANAHNLMVTKSTDYE
jgi:hypothetical protein